MSINQDATPGQGEQLPVVDQRLRVKLDGSYGSRLEGQWFFLQPADEYASRALECHTGKAAPIAQAAPLRYTNDGSLAECPCCESLDVGGAHDTVHCYQCGLSVTKPRPLQNAIDAWNMRTGKPAAPSLPEQSGLVEALERIIAADWSSDQSATDSDISHLKGDLIREIKNIALAALSSQGGEA